MDYENDKFQRIFSCIEKYKLQYQIISDGKHYYLKIRPCVKKDYKSFKDEYKCYKWEWVYTYKSSPGGLGEINERQVWFSERDAEYYMKKRYGMAIERYRIERII